MSLSVTLSQAADLIAAVGSTNTVMLRGQPGIGKSSILGTLARKFPDYLPCYVDCATLDLGDLAMPVIDREAMVTQYAPNARFGVARGQTRPLLLMLDELTKARHVLNMLLPIIQERRIGDVPLPTGTFVLATGNLESDGVGDALPAHVYNRMIVVDVANPTNREWRVWAQQAGVHTAVLHFAHENPQVFERYDQIANPKGNPMIFNPLTGNVRAFCSPRSLVAASNILHAADALGDALLPALAGAIGEPAARMLEVSVAMDAKVPSSAAILADPQRTRVPTDAASLYYLAIRCAAQFGAASAQALATYVARWTHAEAQTLFATSVCEDPSRVALALRTTTFRDLASKCGKFF